MNSRVASALRWCSSVLILVALIVLTAVAVSAAIPSLIFGDPPRWVLLVTLLAVLIVPTAVWIGLELRSLIRLRARVVIGSVCVAAVAWLAWDPAPMPATANAAATVPDGDASYALLMRYSNAAQPSAAARELLKLVKLTWLGEGAAKPDAWRAFLEKNRTAIEAEWTALAPARSWIEELNRYPVIGDVTPARFDAPILNFQLWRILTQRTCGQASLLAIDGHGDEALRTLLPLLEVSQKIEPTAHTLVRQMTAKIIQRTCFETLRFIVATARISPELRDWAIAALRASPGPDGAKRIVLGEHEFWSARIIEQVGPSWSRTPALRFLTAVAINRHATQALRAEHMEKLAALAASRSLDQMKQEQDAFATRLRTHSPKNIGGRAMLAAIEIPLDRVVASYWRIEDLRAQVLAAIPTT